MGVRGGGIGARRIGVGSVVRFARISTGSSMIGGGSEVMREEDMLLTLH